MGIRARCQQPFFLMTDPSHFDVFYEINPWMQPKAWGDDDAAAARRGRLGFGGLAPRHREGGRRGRDYRRGPRPARPGVPRQRRGGAGRQGAGRPLPPSASASARRRSSAPPSGRLKARGLVREVIELAPGVFQEGAGDCIWDADRGLFWAGFGQRSTCASLAAIADTFGRRVVGLELATAPLLPPRHLLLPAGGRQGALLSARLHARRAGRDPRPCRARRPRSRRATRKPRPSASTPSTSDATSSWPARRHRCARKLAARGYRLHEVDLAPFILSGGAAYCMTLRLDRRSRGQEPPCGPRNEADHERHRPART